jgi:hypothetical protein
MQAQRQDELQDGIYRFILIEHASYYEYDRQTLEFICFPYPVDGLLE